MRSDIDEKQLIQRAIDGDQSAFRDLILIYQDYVYSICLSVLKVPMESEEAAQDTFFKVYKSIKTYNFTSKFSTWLYSIAYRTSIDYYRKRKRTEDIDSIDYSLTGTVNNTETIIEKQELISLITMVLEDLGQEERTLITLFYLEEQSVKEMIEITGLQESNIKVKLFRARKKLYTLLSDKYSAFL